MSVNWIFDKPPASGKRSGGNAAMYALTPALEIFIREVIQNSKDQGPIDKTKPVNVTFKIVTLTDTYLEDFLRTINWEELEKHLLASDSEKINMPYKQNIEKLKKTNQLTLMIIEDKNTTGLCGPEVGFSKSKINKKNFSSLIRDELYSDKPGDSAGGSYGLGKAVLWRFSQFSTVLFSSNLAELDENQTENRRFIGRTSLPWHQTLENSIYSGDGWFGEEDQEKQSAVSIWGVQAKEISQKLLISNNNEFGTSILILGFYEPINEEREIEDIIKEMEFSIKKWFWPSLFSKRKTLEIIIESWENNKRTEYKEISKASEVGPFVEILNLYENNALKSELNNVGDVIKAEIEINVPAKYDGTPRCDCKTTLLVKLSSLEKEKELMYNVAFYRGFGMVTEYLNLKGLSFTARPFHAILVCGDARIEEDNNDDRLEEFLTLAEPPEHTRWESNERLKKYYKPGYKKALVDMHNDVKMKIKELVSEKIQSGKQGPKLLMQKFPLGVGESGGGKKAKFYFQNIAAELENGVWKFFGDIITSQTVKNKWVADIDLQFVDEEGGGEGKMIKKVNITKGKSIIDNGICRIECANDITNLSFKGESDPQKHPIDASSGAVRLVINAKEILEVANADN